MMRTLILELHGSDEKVLWIDEVGDKWKKNENELVYSLMHTHSHVTFCTRPRDSNKHTIHHVIMCSTYVTRVNRTHSHTHARPVTNSNCNSRVPTRVHVNARVGFPATANRLATIKIHFIHFNDEMKNWPRIETSRLWHEWVASPSFLIIIIIYYCYYCHTF